jgi:ribosomal protein L32
MSELKGYTWREYVESGKRIAIEIKSGKYPEGTDPMDWRICGEMAVYCPYVPLQTTSAIKNEEEEEEEEEDNPDLNRCPNCDEKAWDGRICHICGAKNIGE